MPQFADELMKYAFGSIALAGIFAGVFLLRDSSLAGAALPAALVIVSGALLVIQVVLIMRTLRTRT